MVGMNTKELHPVVWMLAGGLLVLLGGVAFSWGTSNRGPSYVPSSFSAAPQTVVTRRRGSTMLPPLPGHGVPVQVWPLLGQVDLNPAKSLNDTWEEERRHQAQQQQQARWQQEQQQRYWEQQQEWQRQLQWQQHQQQLLHEHQQWSERQMNRRQAERAIERQNWQWRQNW